MVRAQKRVSMGAKILQYYTTKRWEFKNDRSKALFARMTTEDKKTFFFDLTIVDWHLYIHNYILGVRQYLLNEPLSNLPQARKNLRRLVALSVEGHRIPFSQSLFIGYTSLIAVWCMRSTVSSCGSRGATLAPF